MSSETSTDDDALWAAFLEFLTAPTWEDLYRVLKQHPGLLGEQAEAWLEALLEVEEEPRARQSVADHLSVLRHCRLIGVDAVFQSVGLPTALQEEGSGESSLSCSLLAERRRAEEAEARYQQGDDPEALQEAVAAWQQLLVHPDFPTTGNSFRWAALNDAGNTFFHHYELFQQGEDLDRAVAGWESVAAEAPPDSRECVAALNNLGNGFLQRYKKTGNRTDLEQALQCWEQAVSQVPGSSNERARILVNLGRGLLYHQALTEDVTTLRRALESLEQAVQQLPPGSPQHTAALTNLAMGRMTCYERFGTFADVEEAIQVLERLVAQTAPRSPDLPQRLNDLGAGLRLRYNRTGRLTDLEQALQYWEQAVQQTPPGSLDSPVYLHNLGIGLSQLYDRSKSQADLDRAVQVLDQAVRQTAPDSPDLPARLNSLGNALRQRFGVTGMPDVLEQAIGAYRQAVELTRSPSLDRPLYLNNLGAGLNSRYDLTADLADLDEAIQFWQQAVEQSPPGSPDLPRYRNNLATGRKDRYERLGRPADREGAVSDFRQAAREGLDVLVEEGLRSARNWGNWAFAQQAWEEAAEAYDYVRVAGERLFQIQLVRQGKERWLRETQGIPARMAYALAKIGDLRGAVVALEQGRARLLAEVLERNRADLESLRLHRPEIYERYYQAAARVAGLENSESPAGVAAPLPDFIVKARTARAELDAVVEAIRQMPGYEDFLTPPTFAHIQSALDLSEEPSALVYLVTTSVGSLALILRSGEVEVVWSDFTEVELDALLMQEEDNAVGGYLGGQAWEATEFEEMLAGMLSLLGEWLIAPVAARLRTLGVKEVVLIPSGRLALLPLHAAFYSVARQTTCLLEEFVVSYTPTARTLTLAYRAAQQQIGERCLVGVGNPLPHPRPLHAAEAELHAVAAFFPDKTRHTLYGEAATRAALLAQIRYGTHLHFACHGLFDLEHPLDSCLELSGEDRLTLQDLLYGEAQPARARLAVLSACQSGMSDSRQLPDEFIGLPAAFLQAGVPGVLGTLWTVDDFSTSLIMIKFYDYLLGEDRTTGDALRRAQLWLRGATADELLAFFQAARASSASLPSSEGRNISSEVAAAGLIRFALEEPQAQPFADSPFHWAAFVFVGV